MCGIAGYYTPGKPAEQSVVQAMCRRIVHRGPDDEGIRVERGCGIGMRRLSIIDLGGGHQPIANEDDSVWVVFNGEIYNYQPLRSYLEGHGHRFRTQSDTETLVHLYEQEGAAGLHRLRGMYACAIWDSRRNSILLVRDRFGKKPLYYAVNKDGLYFASELKCLLEAGVPVTLDADALKLYFQFSYIPDPWSPYKEIRKLPPAGWLRFDADGRVEQGQYWTLPVPAEAGSPDEGETLHQLREKFDESVRVRMIADVPLGAFLSGGIDSSSVVASMARQSKEPVRTFSIGFEEADYNELPYARMVADQYKTAHHEMIVKPDSVALAQRLVSHFDEPFGDSSSIPTFLVSEFAVQHVKVALTGDGGDELFAGYESFFWVNNARRFDVIPKVARQAIGWLADQLPYSAYGKNYLRMMSRPTPLLRYFELNYAPYYLRRRLLTSDWMLPADQAFLERTFAHCLVPNGADILTQALYFEATAKLTGDMLVKVDRMSMAASLEVRCPMLDHELAELAARIPHESKMRGGRGKDVVLRALGDRLPNGLLNRPKKGFAVPLPLWFRGALRPLVWDTLRSKEFLGRGMVSEGFVKTLLEEHDSGRRNNSHWLWMLLMLELWFRGVPKSR